MPIVNAFGFAAVIVPELPRLTVVPLYVTELLVSEPLPILLNVLLLPLIVLLVSV